MKDKLKKKKNFNMEKDLNGVVCTGIQIISSKERRGRFRKGSRYQQQRARCTYNDQITKKIIMDNDHHPGDAISIKFRCIVEYPVSSKHNVF